MPTTRRSISIKGITYERTKLYAEQTQTTISALAEKWVAEKLDSLGVRTFTVEEAEALRPKNQGGKPPLARPEKRIALATREEAAEATRARAVKAARDEEKGNVSRVTKEPGGTTAPVERPVRGGGVHSF